MGGRHVYSKIFFLKTIFYNLFIALLSDEILVTLMLLLINLQNEIWSVCGEYPKFLDRTVVKQTEILFPCFPYVYCFVI